MEPWQTIPLADAPAALRRNGYIAGRLAAVGSPTNDEIILALRVAGLGRTEPMRQTLEDTVLRAVGATVSGEAIQQGMIAFVESVTGERVNLRPRIEIEISEAGIREDLARWVAVRRADLDDGEDPCCLEAAAALAERPPVFLVALVITRIQDEIRSAVADHIGELADGDGSGLGRQAVRIVETAWREAAQAWVAARA